MKKFLLTFLSFLVLFTSVVPNFLVAKAQNKNIDQLQNRETTTQAPVEGTWYNQSFAQWYDKVENSPPNEIFGERYTAAQVQWVFYGVLKLIFSITGEKGEAALSCVMSSDIGSCADKIKDAVESLGSQPQSSATSNTSLGGVIYSTFTTRPISGIGYFHQKINNFKLVPEANAQGFGYTAANPIQKLWSAFRDLAFGLIVVVALVLAFMVMFRMKINPQVVVTLQSAIPKVIWALILITFSYAIAGFMIDLMYVVMGLLAAFFANSGISNLSAPAIFQALNSTENILSLSFKYLFYLVISMMSFFVGLGGSSAVLQFLGAVFGAVLGVLLAVIMFIVVFIAILKILWLLLKTFVNVLIQIALGPLQILLGAITPFGGISGWLRSLASNLAVYPVVCFMYVLSFFFLAQGFTAALTPTMITSAPFLPASIASFLTFPFGINLGTLPTTQTSWSPPLTAGEAFIGLLWVGASAVIMSLIPKSSEIIQSAIAGKPFAYGSAIGEAFGPPIAVGNYGLDYRAAQKRAYRENKLKQIESAPSGVGSPEALKIRQQMASSEVAGNLFKRIVGGK